MWKMSKWTRYLLIAASFLALASLLAGEEATRLQLGVMIGAIVVFTAVGFIAVKNKWL